MAKVDEWVSKLREAIERPYPEKNEELSGWMHSVELETHLLATPRRKTVLFMDRTGDYENDEDLAVDGELEIAGEIDQCYTLLCEQMSALHGAALDEDIDDLPVQTRIEPDDDCDDDDAETKSYLSGAYYDNSDDDEASFWQVGNDYVCIQKLKKWGDGNFQFYVIATVTPRE